ncbi:MAG TPA: hypothetical protein VFU47_07060, partial [Armatimonadota bacterium]|nr:hypothetical protein [Armatimonadota bacterium]
VKMAVQDAPLKDVLAEFFKDSQWKYQVAPAVQDVRISYTTQSEPELAALSNILRQASAKGRQITYREGKGVLYIEPGSLPGESLAQAVLTATAAAVRRTATVTTTQQSMRKIVQSIAEQTGTTITVAPTVPDLPVSIKIQNATADQALDDLVKALRPSLPNLGFRSTAPNTYTVELGAKK